MNLELSGSLLRYVGFERKLSFDAKNVGGAFEALFMRYPAVRDIVLAKDGRVSLAHQIFVNGARLDREKGDVLTTPLKDTDTVSILTLITGG